jgi:hypothetical protein
MRVQFSSAAFRSLPVLGQSVARPSASRAGRGQCSDAIRARARHRSQDERANSRKNSKKTLNTSKKMPAANGIASSVPALRSRLKSTIV